MAPFGAVTGTETVRNYAGGEWTDPTGDESHPVVNPATGETLATTRFSSESDVDETVGEALDAFETWSKQPVEERIQPLFKLKELLEEHQDDMARTLVEEHGKTLGEARGELRRGIENVEVACGIPSMMQSGTLQHAAPDIDESAVRQPQGVYTAITPFNFPGMIPLWFLPYAVATGNAFVLKPSERDPLTSQYLFELIDEAGFPPGVVSLLNGGPDTVNALLEHDDVEGVSFVGSTPIARHVYETAAANGKRVQAQGGAKNHVIVAESADVEFAAEQSVNSALACSGERCLANDVVLVDESVYDEFRAAALEEVESQVLGNGLDDETTIGPLITPEHEESVREMIQTGIDEGADLIHDGRDWEADGDGNFLGPCLFENVEPGMTIVDEEIFGPVLSLATVSDIDEAIETMNQSRFGNAASLFTDSGRDARKFKEDAEAGNLAINAGTAAPMAFFHFGGQKDSFFGDLHAQGEDMIHFYTDKKIAIERWDY
ncbi:CoA-acylating methylmalonate-semialdehyde dehydrogenase [Halosegnis longus]|uniref:methylmalonate-semialdehyde dehydrogenase (CoA acylating) n=1 Tax=Halosegnis longus TaxID=2216012 RepID=A0AAJ4R7F3_9EURY|nr:CoA-acylating methylmalonate-semialdehyde dehydrogenase [Halosegnis longus]RNJ26041.1 CoA-acylating methylmalonate-semialdehyde dehydrogenase [Salella cibi]